MKTRCHNCGATASLDMLVSTNAAGQAFAAAFDVPSELKPLMIKYLGLFRPADKALAFGRAATLLNQITPYINDGKLTFNKITTDAPLGAWAWGIEQVLIARDAGTLTLPLSTHNYLYKVVQGYDYRKHGDGTGTMKAWGGSTGSVNTSLMVMLNGVKKPVLAGKTQQETVDIVRQEQIGSGESMDETYERIKGDYEHNSNGKKD